MNHQKFIDNIGQEYTFNFNIVECKKTFNELEVLQDFIQRESFIRNSLYEVILKLYEKNNLLNIEYEKNKKGIFFKIFSKESLDMRIILNHWIDFLQFCNDNFPKIKEKEELKKIVSNWIDYKNLHKILEQNMPLKEKKDSFKM